MKQLFYVTFRHYELYAFELEATCEEDAIDRMQQHLLNFGVSGAIQFRGDGTENWKAVCKGGAL